MCYYYEHNHPCQHAEYVFAQRYCKDGFPMQRECGKREVWFKFPLEVACDECLTWFPERWTAPVRSRCPEFAAQQREAEARQAQEARRQRQLRTLMLLEVQRRRARAQQFRRRQPNLDEIEFETDSEDEDEDEEVEEVEDEDEDEDNGGGGGGDGDGDGSESDKSDKTVTMTVTDDDQTPKASAAIANLSLGSQPNQPGAEEPQQCQQPRSQAIPIRSPIFDPRRSPFASSAPPAPPQNTPVEGIWPNNKHIINTKSKWMDLMCALRPFATSESSTTTTTTTTTTITTNNDDNKNNGNTKQGTTNRAKSTLNGGEPKQKERATAKNTRATTNTNAQAKHRTAQPAQSALRRATTARPGLRRAANSRTSVRFADKLGEPRQTGEVVVQGGVEA